MCTTYHVSYQTRIEIYYPLPAASPDIVCFSLPSPALLTILYRIRSCAASLKAPPAASQLCAHINLRTRAVTPSTECHWARDLHSNGVSKPGPKAIMQQPSQGPPGASRGLIPEDACSSESTHVCDYDNLEGQDQDIECMEMLSAPDWRVRRQGTSFRTTQL